MDGKRKKFKAIFEKQSFRPGYMKPVETILLKNIVLLPDQENIAGHLWFNYTKGFKNLNLQRGDVIEFEARIKEYVKGYRGDNWEKGVDKPVSLDYKLSYPIKVEKI